LCSNIFFLSSRRRHTRSKRDWSSDVCSSDLDEMILSLLKNISKVKNARTVKVVYEQGHNSVDLDLDVDGLKNCNYRSLVSNNYAFPSYAIKTRRGASDFTEMFRSKDNP